MSASTRRAIFECGTAARSITSLKIYRKFSGFSGFDAEKFQAAAEILQNEFPNLKIIAGTLREIISASAHHLSAVCFSNGEVCKSRDYRNAPVLDRVGGDAFAAGFIDGLLNKQGILQSLECGAASAVLTMTTPGDNLMSTLIEIEQLINGANSRAIR